MDIVIEEYFAERKEAWLKSKLKANQSDDEKKKLDDECDEKYLLENWLPDAAKRAGQLSLVSHNCKFTHPSSKTNSIIAIPEKKSDGYVRSGNSNTALDVFGNAAALDVFKFLSLRLEDDKTILEHLELGSDLIKHNLMIKNASFEEIQKGLLSIKQSGKDELTGEKIKQIYFPYNDDYHLLSILTPSGLMFELKKRIDKIRYSEENKEVRELRRKNIYSENGFDDLLNLTTIGFGGTKPQNISVLNSQNGGKAYLLPCCPPQLDKNKIRLPKYDFFKNCLWLNNFKDSFSSLHKLVYMDYNNVQIRKGRDKIIKYIIDNVINEMWVVRNNDPGWSLNNNYSNLPSYQKIWLDSINTEKRYESDEWLFKVINELSRWIVNSYNKLYGKSGKKTGDDELKHIRTLIEQDMEVLR